MIIKLCNFVLVNNLFILRNLSHHLLVIIWADLEACPSAECRVYERVNDNDYDDERSDHCSVLLCFVGCIAHYCDLYRLSFQSV